jgi:hypothetical protein
VPAVKESKMVRTRTTYFAIPAEEVAALGVEALMDMLRYDGARVIRRHEATEAHPRGLWVFAKEAEGYPEPTVGRWASFGVRTVYLMDQMAGGYGRVSEGAMRYENLGHDSWVAVPNTSESAP